jgi:hypothetical protein
VARTMSYPMVTEAVTSASERDVDVGLVHDPQAWCSPPYSSGTRDHLDERLSITGPGTIRRHRYLPAGSGSRALPSGSSGARRTISRAMSSVCGL